METNNEMMEEKELSTNGGLDNEVVDSENEVSGEENQDKEVVQEVEKTGTEEQGETEAVSGGVDEAIEKLQSELKNAKDKSFAEPVITHLVERVKDSESLAKDILHKAKSWEKCYQYIYSQARKQIKGSSGAVRDEVVYEWAEDYFHKDEKELAKENAIQKAVATAVAGPKKDKPKSTPKKEEKAWGVKKPEEKEASAKKEVTPEKPKPKKNEMEGQIDLFSMMGL